MGIITAMVRDLEHLDVVRQWKEELDALYAKEDEEE